MRQKNCKYRCPYEQREEKERNERNKLIGMAITLSMVLGFFRFGCRPALQTIVNYQQHNQTKAVQTHKSENPNITIVSSEAGTNVVVSKDTKRQENSNLETKVGEAEKLDINENLSEEDINWLTKGMYGEARGEVASGCLDYVRGCAKSVITRSKLRNKSIKDILLETRIKNTENGKIKVYQYTCFDPNDVNYQEINNPSDLKTFELCKQMSKELLQKNSFPEVTNFYVGKNAFNRKYRTKEEIKEDKIPSWAFETRNENFIRDSKGYFIPRKPILIASVRQTKKNPEIKSYFYYFENF